MYCYNCGTVGVRWGQGKWGPVPVPEGFWQHPGNRAGMYLLAAFANVNAYCSQGRWYQAVNASKTRRNRNSFKTFPLPIACRSVMGQWGFSPNPAPSTSERRALWRGGNLIAGWLQLERVRHDAHRETPKKLLLGTSWARCF
jgi:hypothetical protein